MTDVIALRSLDQSLTYLTGKRILVFLPALATGGAERMTVSFLAHPLVRNLDVSVCTLYARQDGPLANEVAEIGVERLHLGALRRSNPVALFRLASLIRRRRIDLVHGHGPEPAVYGVGARFLTGVPVIFTRHVIEELWTNWRQKTHVRWAVAASRHADAVVAVSRAAADRLVELSGMDVSRLRTIYNGIDPTPFRPDRNSESIRALKHRLGIGSNQPIVLVLSVLRAGKGHEVLIRAMPKIWHRHPGAHLLIAGSGEQEAALRALAQPYGEKIRFLGNRTDIPDLMAISDLVALPSFSEALPMALIEAGAAGKPVVATRVGGTEEVVKDRHTGLLVNPGDPDALAKAISTILDDKDMAERMGSAGLERISRMFTLDVHVHNTINLWAEVLKRPAK
jgi:glycosyltransferase involved in cell wall biosynthesis